MNNQYSAVKIPGGYRVVNPEGIKVWDFTGYFPKEAADKLVEHSNEALKIAEARKASVLDLETERHEDCDCSSCRPWTT